MIPFASIAFVGRSNVGKSSLLNALTRNWGVARTSDKPGLTQVLNRLSCCDFRSFSVFLFFFLVIAFQLVDDNCSSSAEY